jgi:hypothetical protein
VEALNASLTIALRALVNRTLDLIPICCDNGSITIDTNFFVKIMKIINGKQHKPQNLTYLFLLLNMELELRRQKAHIPKPSLTN